MGRQVFAMNDTPLREAKTMSEIIKRGKKKWKREQPASGG